MARPGVSSKPVKRRKPWAGRTISSGAWRRRRVDVGLGMANLAERECVPCKGGVPPLRGEDLVRLSQQLGEGWRVVNEHHLERDFTFDNFRQALDFTNRVGSLAEAQQHHPDIYLAWG